MAVCMGRRFPRRKLYVVVQFHQPVVRDNLRSPGLLLKIT
jgi:hypothetical protein